MPAQCKGNRSARETGRWWRNKGSDGGGGGIRGVMAMEQFGIDRKRGVWEGGCC